MTIHMRPYAGVADLQRILDLKRACTTPENMDDAPTPSEMSVLLMPFPHDSAAEHPPWEDEQGRVIGHLYRRAMTQRATMLWPSRCIRKRMAAVLSRRFSPGQ
jgi:hypothetical protein